MTEVAEASRPGGQTEESGGGVSAPPGEERTPVFDSVMQDLLLARQRARQQESGDSAAAEQSPAEPTAEPAAESPAAPTPQG